MVSLKQRAGSGDRFYEVMEVSNANGRFKSVSIRNLVLTILCDELK